MYESLYIVSFFRSVSTGCHLSFPDSFLACVAISHQFLVDVAKFEAENSYVHLF